MGPAASLLLQGAGLSKEDVTPSGPGGIITKGDVMKAIAGQTSSKSAETDNTEPYMVESADVPTLCLFECIRYQRRYLCGWRIVRV